MSYKAPYMSIDAHFSRTPKTLGYFLKRAQHAFRTRIDEALRPVGLTAPQFAVLVAIDADAGISNAALARAAFVTPQSMQGMLSNLERDGLLTRTNHPGHGRILRNQLTPRGRQILEEARCHVQEAERLIAEAVGPDHLGEFVAMLSRCADRLSAEKRLPQSIP